MSSDPLVQSVLKDWCFRSSSTCRLLSVTVTWKKWPSRCIRVRTTLTTSCAVSSGWMKALWTKSPPSKCSNSKILVVGVQWINWSTRLCHLALNRHKFEINFVRPLLTLSLIVTLVKSILVVNSISSKCIVIFYYTPCKKENIVLRVDKIYRTICVKFEIQTVIDFNITYLSPCLYVDTEFERCGKEIKFKWI